MLVYEHLNRNYRPLYESSLYDHRVLIERFAVRSLRPNQQSKAGEVGRVPGNRVEHHRKQ